MNLFSDFKPVSKATWLTKVEKDLKGKPIDGLNWQLTEEVVVSPFAHADDIKKAYPPLRGRQLTNQWDIGVFIPVVQIKMANQEALHALGKGATAICFELKKSLLLPEIKILLQGIQLEWITTHFSFKQYAWKRFIGQFIQYVTAQGYDKTKIVGSFNFKETLISDKADLELLASYTQQLPNVRFLTINAIPSFKKTAGVVQEIATAINQGNQQLIHLHKAGLELVDYHSNIQFAITLGDHYFLNIAKIRALKVLWQQVLKAWDSRLKGQAIIEVHLTKVSQSKDEHYNKIKATAQALSAIVGGVKRLYIHPSDAFKNGVGTPFAQRIALNIQHLMQLESYLHRVIDPAAGSYYIEQLTDQLAHAAWKEFQK